MIHAHPSCLFHSILTYLARPDTPSTIEPISSKWSTDEKDANIRESREEDLPIDQVPTLDREKEPDDGESSNIEKKVTLSKFDLENRAAHKGDDSDGRVEWNWRSRCACFFLCTLYTVATTLVIAVVVPYTGYLQDLFGKRYICLCGALLLSISSVLLGSAQSFGQAVTRIAISGARAAIGELTGIAGIYNGVSGIGLLIFYHPRNHARAAEISYRAVLEKIDYVGSFLSVVGVTLFLVALQASGYTHPWSSAYVLCYLLIGFFSIGGWVAWEWKFAPYPMVPREIFQGQRIVAIAYAAAFMAGMNFYFIPLAWSAVYPNKPMSIAEKGLAQPIATTLGSIGFNAALSMFRNYNRQVLLVAACLMTAFTGALAASTPNNAALTVTMVALGSLEEKLPEYTAEDALAAGLPPADATQFVTVLLTDPTTVATVPGITPKILEVATMGVRWAYADSLKYVWYTSIPLGVCAVIVLLFMPSDNVDSDPTSAQVEARESIYCLVQLLNVDNEVQEGFGSIQEGEGREVSQIFKLSHRDGLSWGPQAIGYTCPSAGHPFQTIVQELGGSPTPMLPPKRLN
ncbi:uncharacterized protein Z518_11148 [Rhinocladiella mackenziei CBS 650.93]|uniref:Major facilitator superfamily (MFS) profile domain-containing protein n=1 Tax=Rhinocladiella mackenziei CBS 650.93 TaxID=1442369 RepID=A0A0D2I904_9EURO|nr:uncharacterized protein Z518_11148 [Rhinocladiella mackenziei CBS 650.93]KIW99735.1 hypothetical protein Z518_11148 [Rhinocladiella mackenziei CBS 650.93]